MMDYNAMSLDEIDQALETVWFDSLEQMRAVERLVDRRRPARDAILDMAEQLDAEGLEVVSAVDLAMLKIAAEHKVFSRRKLEAEHAKMRESLDVILSLLGGAADHFVDLEEIEDIARMGLPTTPLAPAATS